MGASSSADRSSARHGAGVGARIVAAGVLALGCFFAGAGATAASSDDSSDDSLRALLTDEGTASGEDAPTTENGVDAPIGGEPSTGPTPSPEPTSLESLAGGASGSDAGPLPSQPPSTTDPLASEPPPQPSVQTSQTETEMPAPTVPPASIEPLPVAPPSAEASPIPEPSSDAMPVAPIATPVEQPLAQPTTDAAAAPDTTEPSETEPSTTPAAPSRASDAKMIDGASTQNGAAPRSASEPSQRPHGKGSKGPATATVAATAIVVSPGPMEECVLETAAPDAPDEIAADHAFIPHGPDPVLHRPPSPGSFDGPMSVIDEAAVSSAGFILAPRVSGAVAVAMDFAKAGSGWAGPLVFNVWLRRQMRERRMSQRQLGLQSGVDHSTISRLLTGRRSPSLETATRLVHALRMEWTDDQVATYFDLLPEQTLMPTQRVESALRGDGALDDDDIRAVMNRYLVLRARRRRLKVRGSPEPIDIHRAFGEP